MSYRGGTIPKRLTRQMRKLLSDLNEIATRGSDTPRKAASNAGSSTTPGNVQPVLPNIVYNEDSSAGTISTIPKAPAGTLRATHYPGGPTFVKGGNLDLAGPSFTPDPNGLAAFISDGNRWRELSRGPGAETFVPARRYGAVPDTGAEMSGKIQKAFDQCPLGQTLVFEAGIYLCSSVLTCTRLINVWAYGAVFDFSAVTFTAGATTETAILFGQTARTFRISWRGGKVYRSTATTDIADLKGNGFRWRALNSCWIQDVTAEGFYRGHFVTGSYTVSDGEVGNAYTAYTNLVAYACRFGTWLDPGDSQAGPHSGWANENNFFSGRMSLAGELLAERTGMVPSADPAVAGSCAAIYINKDALSSHECNNNRFYGMSLEGSVTAKWGRKIYGKGSRFNEFIGCRYERPHEASPYTNRGVYVFDAAAGDYYKFDPNTNTSIRVQYNEVLTNSALTGAPPAEWAVTGDWALTGNQAVFTRVTGNGTLKQTAANFAIPAKVNYGYWLSYNVVSSTLAGGTFSLTTAFGGTATTLSTAVGHQRYFINTGGTTGDFILDVTGATSGALTLDDIFISDGPIIDVELVEQPAATGADNHVFRGGYDLTNIKFAFPNNGLNHILGAEYYNIDVSGRIQLRDLHVGVKTGIAAGAGTEFASRSVFRGNGGTAPLRIYNTSSAGPTAPILDVLNNGFARRIRVSDGVVASQLSGMSFYSGNAGAEVLRNQLYQQGSALATEWPLAITNGLRINVAGADADSQLSGNNDANLFYADASTDRIGIGLNAPQQKLQVNGDGLRLSFSTGANDYTDIHHIDRTDFYGGLSIQPAVNSSTLKWITLFGTSESNALTMLDDGTDYWGGRTSASRNLRYEIATGMYYEWNVNFDNVLKILGPTGPTGSANFRVPSNYSVSDTTNNTVLTPLILGRGVTGGGFGAAGIGERISWALFNSVNSPITASEFDVVFDVATSGSEDSSIRFKTRDAGTLKEILQIEGATPRVLVHNNHASTPDIIFGATGGAVFNEQSNAVDFRVESDGNANMLFVDGTNNRVGIGTNAPSVVLDSRGGAIFNEDAAAASFRVEVSGSGNSNALLVQDQGGGAVLVGIRQGSPAETLHVGGNIKADSSIRIAGDTGSGATGNTTITNAAPVVGGGSTIATFGANGINGVGLPGTAAQAGWVKIYVGTTAAWLPYWT